MIMLIVTLLIIGGSQSPLPWCHMVIYPSFAEYLERTVKLAQGILEIVGPFSLAHGRDNNPIMKHGLVDL